MSCPNCGQIDKVENVRAVVSREIMSGTYEGSSVAVAHPTGEGHTTVAYGRTTLYGGSQTLLSQRLAPPARPSAKTSCAWLVGLIIAIVVSCAFLCSGAMILDIIGVPSEFAILLLLAALGLGAAIFIGAILYTVKENKEERERVRAEMPRWKQARERWGRLCYCGRCHGVFDPDERVFVPVDHILGYLYR